MTTGPVDEVTLSRVEEALDDLGVSVATSVARLSVGEKVLAAVATDIEDDRRTVDDAKVLVDNIDHAAAVDDDRVARMSGYYHGLGEVGGHAWTTLEPPVEVGDPTEPEPPTDVGPASAAAKVCIGAAEDIAGLDLSGATRRFERYREHKRSGTYDAHQMAYVDGIGEAIDEIVDATRNSLERRVLKALRAETSHAGDYQVALLLFVAATGCGPSRLDRTFDDLFGDDLAQELIDGGLVAISVSEGGDEVLTVTAAGVRQVRDALGQSVPSSAA